MKQQLQEIKARWSALHWAEKSTLIIFSPAWVPVFIMGSCIALFVYCFFLAGRVLTGDGE